MSATAAPKRLMRDPSNAVFGGVASGMAQYFEIDPVLMRVIFVLVAIFTAAFPAILAYLILWAIIPPMPVAPAAPPAQAPSPPVHGP